MTTTSSTITFQKTYGGPDEEYIGNVLQASDSGYIIIGTSVSFGAGDVLNIATPAPLVINPQVDISIGSIHFDYPLISGTRGIEATLCHN